MFCVTEGWVWICWNLLGVEGMGTNNSTCTKFLINGNVVMMGEFVRRVSRKLVGLFSGEKVGIVGAGWGNPWS